MRFSSLLKWLLILTFSLLVLTGCDSLISTPTPTPIPTATHTPTLTATATLTLTPTPLPTPTPINLTEAGLPCDNPLACLLRFVPDTPEYRQSLIYGDVNAWHNSWNIERVNNLEELETLGRQPSAYWKIIMPKQVLPPSSLGIDFLFTEDQRSFYGFDLFNLDRFLSAGNQPDLLTVAQYSFDKAQIENALLASGYQAEKLETEDALYSILDDYEMDLEFPVNTGKLGNLNRIFVYDDHMIVAKASTIVTNSLAAYMGETPSLGEDPAHIAAAMALENPELSDTGELVGAVLMEGSQFGDTRYYLSHFVNPHVIQELRESTQEIQLPPFSLVAFATRHTEGASYLVLAVVFPEGTDAGEVTNILADRLQNYTSFFSGETFEERWTFEKAVGIEANGLPVALVVMRVDDPPPTDENAAMVDSKLFTWDYLVSKGDVLFLVPEQPQE